MLITRETDYALRILRALADGERRTMKTLCQAEAVPQQFAYKILKKLSRAGLVQSTRGVDGGCQLTGDLEATTLYDLVEIMEGDRQVSACMAPGYQCPWVEAHRCPCTVHGQLAAIQRRLDRELRSHTIQSLLGQAP